MAETEYPTHGYRGETPAPPEPADFGILAMDRVQGLCRIGQGERCCAFLVASAYGFECAKGTSLEETLRIRRLTMNARGDNCSGWPDFTVNVEAQP